MWFLAYFLIHLSVYTLLRIEFLVWNWPSLKNLSVLEILWAFLNGLRFDLSALSVTVGLCFLGLIWLSEKQILKKIWFFLFIALNSVFYLINIVDIELFNFQAKRFSASTFYMMGEGKVVDFIYPYMKLASISFFILFCYIFLTNKFSQKFQEKFNLKKKIISSLIIIFASVIFARGGLQLKPLTFVDAKIFNNTYANNLILNSSFTILKSLTKNSLARTSYFENKELLTFLNKQDIKPLGTENKKLNIVIILLEGFSKEYLGLKSPEVTPFFNQLRAEGIDFKKSYSNGRRSIEGVAAVLSGIPALMDEPFINSEFSANQIIGLGTILAANDYHTSFFHGTNKGSMHFDRFTKSVGIENHFSVDDFPDQRENDGSWGIFDEPYLQWTCEKLSQFKNPFFSTIFTLSSHQPFNLPQKYVDKFKDERLPILKTIQYVDYSLQHFMKCAEKQAWYNNTLFIFTADHTGPFLHEDASFESRYQVPLLFYGPKLEWLKKIDTNQYAQHIDILPTILDILNIEYKNQNYLSRSLLRTGPKIIALYADRQYQLVGDVVDQDKQLKAIQQYFSEGLYDNRLYYPAK